MATSTKTRKKATTKKASKKATPTKEKQRPAGKEIYIPEMRLKVIQIPIIGVTPLITNKWDEKAKAMIRITQAGGAKMKKAPKDPDAQYRAATYILKGKHGKAGAMYGFPGGGFKKAAVGACRQVDGVNMTDARGAFHIVNDVSDCVIIKCLSNRGHPIMREDMVRLQGTTTDMRYRPEFTEWSAVVSVEYNADVITPAVIINLFNLAGFAQGLGEWRPEKNGAFGQFRVQMGKMKLIRS